MWEHIDLIVFRAISQRLQKQYHNNVITFIPPHCPHSRSHIDPDEGNGKMQSINVLTVYALSPETDNSHDHWKPTIVMMPTLLSLRQPVVPPVTTNLPLWHLSVFSLFSCVYLNLHVLSFLSTFSFFLPLCLSPSLPPPLSLSVSVCLCLCLSVCLSLSLSIYISLSVCLSLSLSLLLSLALALALSLLSLLDTWDAQYFQTSISEQ